MVRILLLCAAFYLLLVISCALLQRRLLFFPSHHRESNGLAEWRHGGEVIGYGRQVPSPQAVWLFLHGNAGQASDRVYTLGSFSDRDTVFILEYPGYGSRPGSPSMESINAAALQAYELLRARFPGAPVGVAAESIGCGPAATLASASPPPEKIVLILPFDTLANVAAGHYPFLPVRLLLRDNWDNVAALKGYGGELELIAASGDTIIPIPRARALAESMPSALLRTIEGDHNDWADGDKVRIRYPRQDAGRWSGRPNGRE